ncbi:hypothetical protein [Bradyrhizobium roseum]|uniref:hypothetical protein n=1 Tax=Bradyrhizobium roseum TaxID=3056648 RepID=UPI00261FBD9A|nr:hypothetical protein [Bradyrhizobium roseus]WKA30581.1 hypothetical protein QUH67_10620 [Bradyrhizobium roseus]
MPEKRMQAGGDAAPEPKREASPETAPNSATGLEAERASLRLKARRMIEDLDHGRFGGPSFSQQTIELLSMALESAEASSGAPATEEQLRSVAAMLLKVAGDGERDPVRLKAAAMSALEPASTADEQPPSS